MGVGFLEQDLRRRSFLKWSSAVAGSGALVGVGLSLTEMPGVGPQQAAAAGDGMADADRTVWSACVVNCGSRCPIRLQIKDGTVERVLPDNTGDDSLFNRQIRACVRGRNMRQRIYNPDRIKTPLKRRDGNLAQALMSSHLQGAEGYWKGLITGQQPEDAGAGQGA